MVLAAALATGGAPCASCVINLLDSFGPLSLPAGRAVRAWPLVHSQPIVCNRPPAAILATTRCAFHKKLQADIHGLFTGQTGRSKVALQRNPWVFGRFCAYNSL